MSIAVDAVASKARDSIEKIRKVIKSIDTDDNLTLTDSTLSISASGMIEANSVAGLKHVGGDVSYELNSDYYVTYNGNTADIDISPVTYAETQTGADSRPWEVSYRYRTDTQEQNAWVTMIYNKKHDSINLQLNSNTANNVYQLVTGIKVENVSSTLTSIESDHIVLQPGWNKIKVLTTDKSGTESYINSIFDTNDPADWANISTYIVPSAFELEFSELTRLTGEHAYRCFATVNGSDGRTWI